MIIVTKYESGENNCPKRITLFCGKFKDIKTAVKVLGLENIKATIFTDDPYIDFDIPNVRDFYTMIDLDKIEENVITYIGLSADDSDDF